MHNTGFLFKNWQNPALLAIIAGDGSSPIAGELG
jgi:hypothetical protein